MKNLDLKDLEIRVTTQDFQKQVEGYGLTTANILYRRPDHPWLLQSYVFGAPLRGCGACFRFAEIQ